MKNTEAFVIAIIIYFFIFGLIAMITYKDPANEYYLINKEEIDKYNEKHANDWKGYKGTRRNSWAEEQELKKDGIDVEKYRNKNGY